MLWLDSVSCHHGDHGEPGSWISANKLVCTLISQSSEPITCEPASMESQQHLKKGFQQHLTKVRLPKKQNLSPSCIRHACIVVSSLMSISMYCATSIQKPFVHIDSERIVQTKWYNQMVGHGVEHQHANGFMLVRYILIMKYSCISLVSFLSRVREHISKTSK
jgi:hypothetical protein